MTGTAAILIVEGDEGVMASLVHDIGELVGGAAELVSAATGVEALELAHRLAADRVSLPVAFVERTLPDRSGPSGSPASMSGAELTLAMDRDVLLRRCRRVLVTSRPTLTDVDTALSRGAIHGMLTRPWSATGLEAQLRAQLATYYTEHDPAGLDAFGTLIDDEARARARERIEQHRTAPPVGDGSHDHLLLAPQLGPEDVERLLLEAVDRVLGHPPRLRVAPGSTLVEQGTDVGGIYLILEGEVCFQRHSDSDAEAGHRVVETMVGPVVGLLSLATQSRAFLEVKALTEVRAIPLTLQQLDRVFTAEPMVGTLMTRVLVNSLAARLRDADRMRVEIDGLAESLASERDELAGALSALEEAQDRLVAQARMATLGELAAGIAHELNNPTAALVRAVEHLAGDVDRLVGADATTAAAIERARTSEAMSSAESRSARRALAERLGDRSLAERLVAAGITDPREADSLVRSGPAAVERLTAAARLGTGLRNVLTASARIADLVDSLRAYLHGGEGSPAVDGVSVVDTIEDALRLLSHKTEGVSLQRHYDPIPAVTARPGPLQQVWTNLVANAVEASGPGGEIEVLVDAPTPDRVRVRVVDDGPGIPDEIRDRLFTPRFTTKHGRVAFGSGLGLSICRQIIEEHGGTIELASGGGRTEATVELPAGEAGDDRGEMG